MKNITEIKKELMKREAGKKEVNVAQVSEILGHLSDMAFEDQTILQKIFINGKRRAKAKK